MRSKFILIYEEDQLKLNHYLNQQSELGWHAESINAFRIKFSYDPNKRYYYNVILKGGITDLNSTPKVFEDHTDLMASFDFEEISKHPNFLIYRTTKHIDLFTDSEVDYKPNKKAVKKMYFNVLSLFFVVALTCWTLSMNGLYGILISNMAQLSVVLNIIVLIHACIRVQKVYLLFHQKQDDTLSFRWQSKYIDPLTLIYFIFVTSLLLTLVPINLQQFIIPAILMAISMKLISKLNIKIITSYILQAVVIITISVITINLMVRNTLSSVMDSSHKSTFVYESWIAKEVVTHDHSSLYVKVDFMSDFMIEEFLDINPESPDILEYKVTAVPHYLTTKYLFRGPNYAIISDNEEPESFFLNFFENNMKK